MKHNTIFLKNYGSYRDKRHYDVKVSMRYRSKMLE